MLRDTFDICLVEQVAIQPFPPLPLITNENAGQERKVAGSCRAKPTYHAERERSIFGSQLSVWLPDASLPLSMTCSGQFLIASLYG